MGPHGAGRGSGGRGVRCGDGDFLSMMKAKELELGGGEGMEEVMKENLQRSNAHNDDTPR